MEKWVQWFISISSNEKVWIVKVGMEPTYVINKRIKGISEDVAKRKVVKFLKQLIFIPVEIKYINADIMYSYVNEAIEHVKRGRSYTTMSSYGLVVCAIKESEIGEE